MRRRIEKGLEQARGYYDRVDYIDGHLIIDGWILVPDKPIDHTLLFVDKKFIREFSVVEKEDVEKAFPFIPHARHSGFVISEKMNVQAENLIHICIVAMQNGKQVGFMQTCYSRTVSEKLLVRDKDLMHRVAHTNSVSFFQASGFKSFSDFWEMACKHAAPKKMRTVLDWGCGCGRLTEVFAHLAETKELYGCDIDAEAVTWCASNLRHATFNTIPVLPPTEYPDSFFDLVIGNSVLTHLTKHAQLVWLQELNRIIKQNGLLLATVHGPFAAYFQFQENAKDILQNGIHDDSIDNTLGEVAPKDYYRSTYQTSEYTRREFGKYFKVLDYIEKGSLNFQDMVVMRKTFDTHSTNAAGAAPDSTQMTRNRLRAFFHKYINFDK